MNINLKPFAFWLRTAKLLNNESSKLRLKSVSIALPWSQCCHLRFWVQTIRQGLWIKTCQKDYRVTLHLGHPTSIGTLGHCLEQLVALICSSIATKYSCCVLP